LFQVAFQVGDHVLFPAYSGRKVVVGDEGMYIIMPEDEVVALLGEGERIFTQDEIEDFLDRAYVQVSGGDEATKYIEAFMDLLTSAPIRAMEN